MRRRAALVSTLLVAVATAASAAVAGPGTTARSGSPAPALSKLGIGHVFVIVLENESYDASYVHNANPYLSKVLTDKGALLTQYHAIGHVSQPNYVAMVSGQAPNPMTQSDCQDYVDFTPSTGIVGPQDQAVGAGCVYPRTVKTIADQLNRAHLSWHGYMDDMGNVPSREPRRCGQPGASALPGVRDDTQSATTTDQYAARHNPFVYFHSLLDSGACARNVGPLTALPQDLRRVTSTPRLSFITPNLCNDGHDAPCTGKDAKGSKAGGLVSVDHFLSVWVPRILRSPAFRRDGLLVITTDEAATSDASACCGEKPGPDSPLPGISGGGGGRIGAVLLGRCITPGSRVATAYNHYSLLRSLEDIYGIHTGGSDGKGHLGYAGAGSLRAFGPDVFSAC